MIAKYFIFSTILLGACLADFSIPLTKQVIQEGSKYEVDHLFTFSLEVGTQQIQTLNAIIDLTTTNNWFADQKCSNCFGNAEGQNKAYKSCTDASNCGKETAPEDSVKAVGSNIKITKEISINENLKINKENILLKGIHDVTAIKDTNQIDFHKIILNKVQAGLGFAPTNLTPESLVNLLKSKLKPTKNQISMFFNNDMGRFIYGKEQDFFKGSNNFETLSIVDKSSTGEFEWIVKIGPNFSYGVNSLTTVSTQSSKTPSKDVKDFSYVQFDSTSKYYLFPSEIYERFKKDLFDKNSCQADEHSYILCDCGNSVSWPQIDFELVKNPNTDTYHEKNVAKFSIDSESYLQSTSDGKCLLLIKKINNPAGNIFTFGTAFLQKYYSIFNFDYRTILLAPSHGFVPSALLLNNNYRLPIIIAGAILGLILIIVILALLKRIKISGNYQQELQQITPTYSMQTSYLVRSPRQIESIQQITKSVKSPGAASNPVVARVIQSPSRVYNPSSTVSYYQ